MLIRSFFLVAAPCVILGCNKNNGPVQRQLLEDTGEDTYIFDGDGDGITVEDGDCDDENADVRPGRTEDCNGVDDNCNGLVDEGFPDTDADGLADCLDTEECDGLDNDGDGAIDEGFDSDGDGVADCPVTEVCDGIDNDGNGEIDEGFDVDGDGYTSCGSDARPPDCDDEDETVYPTGIEVSEDLVDNDCDGLIDEGFWAPGDLVITEIMNNPSSVRDTDGEWFELTNTSGRTVVLNGLELASDGEEPHVVVADEALVLPEGARAVFALRADPASNGGVEPLYVYSGLRLSNEADRLIVSADGARLDEVYWDDGETMPDPSGSSISLDPMYIGAIENDDPAYWCSSDRSWGSATDWGTPGQENNPCPQFDHDGDGWTGADGDCDDRHPGVYPGAPEIDLGVDNDCDGDVGAQPIAVADYDAAMTSLVEGEPIYLTGLSSYDPDGGTLSYSWSLFAWPSEPEAEEDTGAAEGTDIVDDEEPGGEEVFSTEMSPTYVPLEPGTYTFSLVVSDGLYESESSHLTLDVSALPAEPGPEEEGDPIE